MKHRCTPWAIAMIAAACAAAAEPPKDKPAEPAKPATTPASPTTPPSGVPSLDDLLGTKPAKPPVAPDTAPPSPAPDQPVAQPNELTDPTRTDLDRLLKGEEIGEAFTEAVKLMDDAAMRLERASDAGLTTQRVQEDVIRRLDQLLASLQRRQSSSSSQQQQQQQQQQQEQQGQRNQPNQKKPSKSKSQSQASQGEGQRNDLGPARQDGALKPNLDAARAAWGGLPERVRDMLMQGSSDRFSSKYQNLTEAYYRRLAEEKK